MRNDLLWSCVDWHRRFLRNRCIFRIDFLRTGLLLFGYRFETLSLHFCALGRRRLRASRIYATMCLSSRLLLFVSTLDLLLQGVCLLGQFKSICLLRLCWNFWHDTRANLELPLRLFSEHLRAIASDDVWRTAKSVVLTHS